MNKVKSKVTHHAAIVGRNLKNIRGRKGWSQAMLAEILQVSCQQIQKYESGKNRIPLEHIYTLKATLGLQYEDFFYGLDDPEGQRGEHCMIHQMNMNICQEVEKIRNFKVLKIIQDIVMYLSNERI